MTFTMKRFALALRRGRSRPLGRCSVTCEMLEGRQLLSTGMQPGELMQMMPAPMSGGWESRWFALAPAAESTGAQAGVVSNLPGTGLGENVQFGSGGAQFQSANGGGTGSTAGAMSTSSAMSLSPGGGEFVLAGSPTRTVSGESIGSIAGSADTSPSTSTLPGNLNVGYGGGQGLLVSNSNNGATVVASPMGIPQGPVEIGAGSGPTQIVGSGTASTTASPTVTSSSPITQTEDLNASYGGGQALLVNNANNGATVTGSPTGIAPGPIQVGSGGPTEIVSGGSGGTTTASSLTSPSAFALPPGLNVGYGGGQALFVNNASNEATVTESPMGIPQGAVEVGTSGGPMEIVSGGSGNTTAASSVTSSSPIALPGNLAVGYGDGQALFVSRANNGATVTETLTDIPQGAVEVGTGSGLTQIVSGGSGGSSQSSAVATSSMSPSPESVQAGAGARTDAAGEWK